MNTAQKIIVAATLAVEATMLGVYAYSMHKANKKHDEYFDKAAESINDVCKEYGARIESIEFKEEK